MLHFWLVRIGPKVRIGPTKSRDFVYLGTRETLKYILLRSQSRLNLKNIGYWKEMELYGSTS